MRGRTNISTFLGWSGENGIPNTDIDNYVWELKALPVGGNVRILDYIDELDVYVGVSVAISTLGYTSYIVHSHNGDDWILSYTVDNFCVSGMCYALGKMHFLATEYKSDIVTLGKQFKIITTSDFELFSESSIVFGVNTLWVKDLIDVGDKFIATTFVKSSFNDPSGSLFFLETYTIEYTTFSSALFTSNSSIVDITGEASGSHILNHKVDNGTTNQKLERLFFETVKSVYINGRIFVFFLAYAPYSGYRGTVLCCITVNVPGQSSTFTQISSLVGSGDTTPTLDSPGLSCMHPYTKGSYVYLVSSIAASDINWLTGRIHKTSLGNAFEQIVRKQMDSSTGGRWNIISSERINDNMLYIFANGGLMLNTDYTLDDIYTLYPNGAKSKLSPSYAPYCSVIGTNKLIVGGVNGSIYLADITKIDTTLRIQPRKYPQEFMLKKDDFVRKVQIQGTDYRIDQNISPENIKKGVAILGVVGTYEGD